MAKANPLFPGGVAVVALVFALAAAAADKATSELVFRPVESPDIAMNGEPRNDARLFATKEWGLYIVDLPSESKQVLLDARSGKAILLMRGEVERRTNKKNEETLRIDPRTPLGDTSYELRRDGDVVGFKTDISEVQLHLPPRERKESPAAPAPSPAPAPGAAVVAAPAPAEPPAPPVTSDAARACVRLETRPTPGIPGCSKSIYLRNTCDAPVTVTMRRTEHLMSGTLPELFDAAVPGGTEEWIGCSWWSGAMAPAQHDIVAAAFLGRRHH
jgi:hypothetical protein